jgi:hypothetical protein
VPILGSLKQPDPEDIKIEDSISPQPIIFLYKRQRENDNKSNADNKRLRAMMAIITYKAIEKEDTKYATITMSIFITLDPRVKAKITNGVRALFI